MGGTGVSVGADCAEVLGMSKEVKKPHGGARPNTGGARPGAGRKKNKVTRDRHVLTFTAEEWASIVQAAGSERKVSRYLVGLHSGAREA